MEVEDLRLWIENYKRYEDRVDMLQREIVELEHAINRNSGSFPKVPDSTTDTRKIQLFFEIDGLMTRQEKLKKRIREVDDYENWCRKHRPYGGKICMYRRMGKSWIYISEMIPYSSSGALKAHETNIKDYLNRK